MTSNSSTSPLNLYLPLIVVTGLSGCGVLVHAFYQVVDRYSTILDNAIRTPMFGPMRGPLKAYFDTHMLPHLLTLISIPVFGMSILLALLLWISWLWFGDSHDPNQRGRAFFSTNQMKQTSYNNSHWASRLAIAGILLPFVGIVLDSKSYDPQSHFGLAAYCTGIALCFPWILLQLEGPANLARGLIIGSIPLAAIAQLIVLLVFSLWVSDCFEKAAVKVERQNGEYEFEIRTRGVNGLHRLTVWDADTRELYWRIDLGYYKERCLLYGMVPRDFEMYNGNKSRAKQTYPASGTPQPLPKGKKFFVHVGYQFDSFVDACAGGDDFAFTTDDEGRVVSTVRSSQGAAGLPPKALTDD